MHRAVVYLCSPERQVARATGQLSGFKHFLLSCILGHCAHPGPPQQPHMQPFPRTFAMQILWDRSPRRCLDMGVGTAASRMAILRFNLVQRTF